MVAAVKTRKTKPPVAPMKLDLACGQNLTPGFIGVDIVPLGGVEVVHDLRKTPWPFPDSSVGETICSHFLEHLTGLERMAFMEELWRVLVPGGIAVFITPYYSSMRAIQDPTHQWPPVAETSYLYYNKAWREGNKLDHYPIHCDFDFSYGYILAPDIASRAQEFRDFAIKSYINAVSDLQVTMTKRVP